ncbi:MAG: flagellar hook-basal body complex protein, partial [Betaproteobacteria bacterium]|nr:flagellar hook-basal body complex protein [Betaproteobacteria bacterium]
APDTIKPVLDTAYVVPNATAGSDLILQYRENKSLLNSPLPAASAFSVSDTQGNPYAVNSVGIDPTTNQVILNTDAIPAGVIVKVSYSPPAVAPVGDRAGNLVAGFTSQAVNNLIPDSSTDGSVPVLSTASVNGNKVTLAYSDASLLDQSSVPAYTDFTLSVDGTALTSPFNGSVSPVIDPVKKTVTLTLNNPIQAGQAVKLSYIPGTNPIQDATTGTRTVSGTVYTGPNAADALTEGVLQNQDTAFADLSFNLTNAVNGTSPTATTPFTFRLNLASVNPSNAFSTTAYADTFAPNKLEQDGHSSGSLAGFSIDNDGNVVARYSNGLTDVKGQIALANFKTPEKLRAVTGNLYAATEGSGEAQAAGPNSNTGNGRLGVLKPGTLELSNVDLTTELVGLITAQRNYQANAKTIQVQSEAAAAILQAV